MSIDFGPHFTESVLLLILGGTLFVFGAACFLNGLFRVWYASLIGFLLVCAIAPFAADVRELISTVAVIALPTTWGYYVVGRLPDSPKLAQPVRRFSLWVGGGLVLAGPALIYCSLALL